MSGIMKIIASLCIVVLCGAAGLWGTRALLSGEDASAGDAAGGSQAIRVGVVSPQVREVEDAVTTVGTLIPIRAVALVPNVPGRVVAVPVVSGQDVAAGDLLIQLDSRAARAALAEAEATRSETRQQFERVAELADRNTAAEAQLEEARAAFRRAEAAVGQAESDLADRAITAPFAGTLGLIDVEPGAVLDGTTPVTRLSDLSSVEVAATLPERYFDRVAVDQTVVVTTPAYPDETFQGRVTVRAPEIEMGTRSFSIRAEIANPGPRLVGGMFANARLVFDTYDGLAIPDDAIISEGLTTYVYVVQDGSAVRTDVSLGTALG
ncbi:MAG: efflux RND transporter periplasmic adaptor subunit, partial [Alphaproteobacteria bacterium]|nr:efflux RND transporter periplasmic adaptor subunit [Alphaproteobacteria bacterium]